MIKRVSRENSYIMLEEKTYILKISCQDAKGIIARISKVIYDLNGFIASLDQYSDPDTKQFFCRVLFSIEKSIDEVAKDLLPIKNQYNMILDLSLQEDKPNILVLCSKQDHCLHDLLQKWKRGHLHANIKGIVSNHPSLEHIANWYKLPFTYAPITPDTKQQQESMMRSIIKEKNIEYIILARYMQIISSQMCQDFKEKIINIHHSFLPSFIGAKPYKQAHKRGVKIVGATAHFVTEDLDEGPIIVQKILNVNHTHTPSDLERMGKDVESTTLSQAVQLVLEKRVFIDENKTVIFHP